FAGSGFGYGDTVATRTCKPPSRRCEPWRNATASPFGRPCPLCQTFAAPPRRKLHDCMTKRSLSGLSRRQSSMLLLGSGARHRRRAVSAHLIKVHDRQPLEITGNYAVEAVAGGRTQEPPTRPRWATTRSTFSAQPRPAPHGAHR